MHTKLALILGLVLLWSAACGNGGTVTYRDRGPLDVESASAEAFVLGPGDVFEVNVYQEKELSGIYQVSPDGRIDFPLVGMLSVEGLAPGQVADLIRNGLMGGYIRNPNVNVYVKEFNSKKVFVLGEVQKPGTFRFEESMNVIQAITLAGGFTDRASKNGTVVTRVRDQVEDRIAVPVEGRSPNFLLRPGDIVFVPESVL
jgi:polysaccharide export outer membrane protein